MTDAERWKQIEVEQSALTLAMQGIKDRVWKALCEEVYDLEQSITRLTALLDEANPTPLEGDYIE